MVKKISFGDFNRLNTRFLVLLQTLTTGIPEARLDFSLEVLKH
jgi:hypothetical protein